MAPQISLLLTLLLCLSKAPLGLFQGAHIVNIVENQPEGTFVFDINQLSASGTPIIGSNKMPLYETHFKYNTGLRHIQTTGPFDRELMVDRQTAPDPVNLELEIYVGGSLHNVIINILDVNDNQPMFKVGSLTNLTNLTKYYDEGGSDQIKLFWTEAIDYDEGLNGTTEYILEQSSPPYFNLSFEYTSSGRVSYVYVIRILPFDRELYENHTFTIRALEGLQENPASSTLNVTIYVRDVDDFPPEFIPSFYGANISEATPMGEFIVELNAYDPDVGSNAAVSFKVSELCGHESHLASCSPMNVENSPFDLGSETGVLTLSADLDHESIVKYVVTVSAQNPNNIAGGSTTAIINVCIIDVNDEAPKIWPYNPITYISESTQVYSGQSTGFVDEFMVKDADSEMYSEFMVELLDRETMMPSPTFGLQKNGNYMRIILLQKLDREIKGQYDLTIRATDALDPSLSTEVNITIIINDVNDNPPVFYPQLMPATVAENSGIGTTVLHVNATDADYGLNAKIKYSLPEDSVGYPHQSLFDIEPGTGLIKVAGSIDYEMVTEMQLMVVAKDLNGAGMSAQLEVDIVVTDVNDNYPEIMAPTLEAISEDIGVGTVVIDIDATDLDSNTLFQYSLINESNTPLPFAINDEGQIRVTEPLDRETIESYDLRVVVDDGQYQVQSEVIRIALMDVNDSPPVFEETLVFATVPEDASISFKVKSVTATDEDTIEMTSISYSIIAGNKNNHFAINDEGTITVESKLDWEADMSFSLEVQAFDGELTSTINAIINITVIDWNDEVPVFTKSQYIFSIAEGNAANVEVGMVEAMSIEKGDNGEMRYSILNPSNLPFVIDELTGQINATQALDRETKGFYSFSVRVDDVAPPPHFNTANVNIIVDDINDNPPMFAVSSLSLNLTEKTVKGAVVLVTKATDADLSPNNQTLYSISGGEEYFSISQKTGQLKLQNSLDFDVAPSVTLMVTATDASNSAFTDTLTLSITVIEDEDTNKTFPDYFPTQISISEDTLVNTPLIEFSGADQHGVPVADLNYFLTHDNGSEVEEFAIFKDPDTNNATIHTTLPLDREQVPVYTLKIVISCSNAPQSMVAQILTIDLLDVNDNQPMFEAPSYQLYVNENEPGMATILSTTKIVVFDPDNGVNGSITFTLKTPSDYFGLEIKQGSKSVSIHQLKPLDREEIAQHSITIVAADQGSPPKPPTEVVVTINVLDKNDNKPSFSPISFNISENQPVGFIVGSLVPLDMDEGANAQVTFHVEAKSTAISNFQLYPNGTIQIINIPDFEEQSEYIFFITAEDGGTPSLSTFGNVTIRVEDINDHCPEFVGGPHFVVNDFDETNLIGSLVINLTAADPDTGPAGVLRYTFANLADWHLFYLDSTTGELSLVEQLDYEQATQHVIEVLAYDLGTPINHVCNATVTINIRNTNEHAPAFDKLYYEISVDENGPPGVISHLLAYDMDADSTITYSISELEPSNGNLFTVVNSELRTVASLDYESKSMHTLLVSASDGDYVGQAQYAIYVNNINDNNPVFTETSYSGFISELATPGTPVLAVKATDADNNTNAAVLYSITTDNGTGMFSIDAHTGFISVQGSLDYEQTTSYTLMVTATDTGAEPRSSSAVVTIAIIGENEFPPMFAQSTYTFSVTEESDDTTSIGQVFADDEDDGKGGVVSYSIITATDDFTIDPVTGTIHPARAIDRESTPTLPTLIVQASDSELTDMAMVEIIVQDINDNPPAFSSSVFNFEIYDTHVSMAAIGTVLADDSDLSPNDVINYTINPETLFTIESSSGQLSLLQLLPDDYQNSYELTVTATDAGNAAFTSTATVHIHIIGENDRPPYFADKTVSVNVTEEMIPMEPIATLVATDADTGSNGIITYTVLGDYTQFSINSDGELSVVEVLDYEESSKYILTIMASNSASLKPRTATTVVVVNVINTNDNDPEFIFYPSSITLSPVPYTSVRLFQVMASDQDGDSVSYVVLSQTSTFRIDPESGWVVNKQPLVSGTYSVEIAAQDPDYGSTSVTVVVSIANPGSGAPSFATDGPYPLSISESKNVNIAIETFSAFGGISEFYLVCCGEDLEPFSLDKDTGVLTLTSMLDYETKTQYQLIVEARMTPSDETHYSDYLQVDVTVQNVNEHAPVFANILNPISIKENSDEGALLTQVTATDDDDGTFGDVSYEIIGANSGGPFEIDPTNGAITVSAGIVLDREKISEYTLQVKAVDGGGLLKLAEVEVTIQDENDSPPNFPQNYSIGVYEPGSVGDLVFTIKAEDADLPVNSQITYSLGIVQAFKGTVSEESFGYFEINSSTGEIKLAATLDRDKLDRYVLPVTASDNEYSTTTEIQVIVVDINDNMPSFTASKYSVEMEELKPVGTVLQISVKANDIDAGTNGIVTYSLGEGWPANKFTIDPHSGNIRVKEPIGYFDLLDSVECPQVTNPSFEGTVIATDSGHSPNSASVTVSVTIMDVNDNPPFIQGSPFSFKISQSASIGHVITDLIITDGDCGPNIMTATGLPDYYAQPSAMFEIFPILPGHYQLRVDAALTEGIYRFRFDAINNSPFPVMPFFYLGSFADIKVEVLPNNDHAPVFVSDVYQDDIYEGNTLGVFLQVKATDNDLGETGRISYSLSPTDIPFEVNEDTGEIFVLETLDREEIDMYQFSVFATDHGYPARSSQTNVLINVLDINDNSPRFLSTSYEGQVQENSPLGERVLKVESEDPDLDEAGTVRYLIPDEDESFPFTIDPMDGVITTSGRMDYEQTSMYSFTVKATDVLDSPMSSLVSVSISVLGMNEFAPSFPSDANYMFDIPSTAERGQVIGTVKAVDEDLGNDGNLVYHINTEGETYFNITSNSSNVGMIILDISPQQNSIVARSPRKRETGEVTVTATITASDMGPTPMSATVLATMVFPPGFLLFRNPTEATIYYIVAAVTGVCLVAILIVVVCILVSVKVKSRKGKVEFCEQTSATQATEIPCTAEQVELELRNVSQPAEINEYTEEPTAAIAIQTQLPKGHGSRHNLGEVDFSASGNLNLSQSPNHRRPSPHTRSTSDLASTVATDILTQDTVPYNKAQIEAIYAANANLLNDGSQDSVHMFGSEGGGEADGDVDIDNMVFTKYDLDTEGSVAGGDDMSYCSKRRSTGSMTFEGGKESEYHFSQSTNPWSSRPGSISRGMNEVGRPESSRPMMYHHYEMSQGPSAFGASTQGSSISLLRSQRRYGGSNGELHSYLPPSHPLPPPVEYFPEATLATPLPAMSSLGPSSHAHSMAHQGHHHNPHQYNLPHSRPSYQYRPSPMTDYSNSGSDGPPPPYFSQDMPYGLPHSYGQTSGHYFHGHHTPPPERCLTPQRQLRAYDHPMLSNSSNSLSSTNNSHRGGSRSFATVESFH